VGETVNVLGTRIPAVVLAFLAAIIGYIVGRKHSMQAAAAA